MTPPRVKKIKIKVVLKRCNITVKIIEDSLKIGKRKLTNLLSTVLGGIILIGALK